MAYTGATYTDKLNTVVADLKHTGYTDTTKNKFSKGQCTWYCFGRAIERAGVTLSITGNGGQWYANAESTRKRAKSLGPISKSIASFSNTGAGHVVFIEQVSGNDVYFTEGNSWVADGTVQKKTKAQFETLWSNTLQGYITL